MRKKRFQQKLLCFTFVYSRDFKSLDRRNIEENNQMVGFKQIY